VVSLLETDWEIYFERGKVDEQIRNLSKRFYSYRDQIINENKSIGIRIFNEDFTNFNSKFEGFLINFFNNMKEIDINDYKQDLYDSAFKIFKKKLYNNLIKRINEKIICDITFSDGYSLFKLMEAFNKISQIIIFRFNQKEIQAYTTNESKTCLMRILFKIKNYNIYQNERLEISIKLDVLLTLLKCRKNDMIQTQLIFKEEQLDLELYSKKNKSKIRRTLKTIEECNEDGILDELLKLEYLSSYEIDNNSFNYLISQSGRLSEVVKLIISNDMIKFSEENSNGTGDIVWKRELLSNLKVESKVIVVYFSMDYLNILTNFMFEPNHLIQLFLEKEIPMKVRIDFRSLEKSYGLLFIAQREPF